jgi:hypothetical protein
MHDVSSIVGNKTSGEPTQLGEGCGGAQVNITDVAAIGSAGGKDQVRLRWAATAGACCTPKEIRLEAQTFHGTAFCSTSTTIPVAAGAQEKVLDVPCTLAGEISKAHGRGILFSNPKAFAAVTKLGNF